jgi:predicted Zn-dependent protease
MIEDIERTGRKLHSPAPFWSLRFVDEHSETLSVRQDVPEPPWRAVNRGAMLTAVINGGYGYAATGDLSPRGLQDALDRATVWAEATREVSVGGFDPKRMPAPHGDNPAPSGQAWPARSALLDLLRQECARARLSERIVDRYASLQLLTIDQLYLTNTGGRTHQRFRFSLPHFSATANEGAETQTRSLDFHQQGGMEVIARSGFVGCGERIAGEALQLLDAPNCPSGKMDLLLMPDQMMLQIHESIGHPLELDRILGDERNYAGTSFVTLDMFGRYQYGSRLLNVTYDPTHAQEMASFAFDDEGARAEKTYLIREGILERPLGGHLSQLRAALPGVANSRACDWNRPPIDRMANLNIEPGASSLEEMIAGIARGVLMRTNVSWSIDDSRNKFQFGCEWGQLIENGELRGVVKNPNYRGISATFWRSLSRVGNRASFEIHGTQFCGKGEPNQAIHVGHAAPACVFSNVDVFGGHE